MSKKNMKKGTERTPNTKSHQQGCSACVVWQYLCEGFVTSPKPHPLSTRLPIMVIQHVVLADCHGYVVVDANGGGNG